MFTSDSKIQQPTNDIKQYGELDQFEFSSNSLLRHGEVVGPIVRHRRRLGYYTAEEYYELTIKHLINVDTNWLDVGCGRQLLPMNEALAGRLSKQCRHLAGVDPDRNVLENDLVHTKVQLPIEDYVADEPFDLITMRMVAEHIEHPDRCIAALRRNTRPGGFVTIYTPHKYSLTSVASAIVPNSAHHAVKNRIWNTDQRDTFPAHYRMNTKRKLRQLFVDGGFDEISIRNLDDAAVFHSRRVLGRIELSIWSLFNRLNVPYPETNILAVFRRT